MEVGNPWGSWALSHLPDFSLHPPLPQLPPRSLPNCLEGGAMDPWGCNEPRGAPGQPWLCITMGQEPRTCQLHFHCQDG